MATLGEPSASEVYDDVDDDGPSLFEGCAAFFVLALFLVWYREPSGLSGRRRTTKALRRFNKWGNRSLLVVWPILGWHYASMVAKAVDVASPLALVFWTERSWMLIFYGWASSWVPSFVFLMRFEQVGRQLRKIALVDNGLAR